MLGSCDIEFYKLYVEVYCLGVIIHLFIHFTFSFKSMLVPAIYKLLF